MATSEYQKFLDIERNRLGANSREFQNLVGSEAQRQSDFARQTGTDAGGYFEALQNAYRGSSNTRPRQQQPTITSAQQSQLQQAQQQQQRNRQQYQQQLQSRVDSMNDFQQQQAANREQWRQNWMQQYQQQNQQQQQRAAERMQQLQDRLAGMEQSQADQNAQREQWRQDLLNQWQQLSGQQGEQAQERYGQLQDSYQQLVDFFNNFTNENPLDQINLDDFRTPETTIDELAERYGFDYSRDYADRQASTEAEAIRNALRDVQRQNQSARDQNLQAIDSAVMNAADALDRDYFQQMLQQQQAQANSGINAGLAADQNLRLQMARQAEMSPIYRDANLGRMQENQRFTNEDLRLLESLGLVDQQELARADSLYNERRQQGFQNALALDGQRMQENLAQLQAALQQRGQNMDMTQFLQQLAQQGSQFNWQAGQQMDADAWNRFLQQTQWDTQQQQFGDQMNWQQLRDLLGAEQFNQQFGQSQDQMNWQRLMEMGGWDTQQQQFGEQMDWSQMMDLAGLDQFNAQFGANLDQTDWQQLLDQVGIGQWGAEFNQRQQQQDWAQQFQQQQADREQAQREWAQQFEEMTQQWRQDQQDWLNRFNYGQAIGQFQNGQQTLENQMRQWQQAMQEQQQNWAQMLDQIALTGNLPDFMGGGQSVQEQQRQWENQFAQEQFNRPYEQLTAWQKVQVDQQNRDRQAALQRALLGQSAQQQQGIFDLPATQFNNALNAYQEGDEETRSWLRQQFPGIDKLVKTGYSEDEMQIFLESIDPSSETLEQAIAKIDSQYSSGAINAETRNALKDVVEQRYEEYQASQPSTSDNLIDMIFGGRGFYYPGFEWLTNRVGNVRDSWNQLPEGASQEQLENASSGTGSIWQILQNNNFGAVPPEDWRSHFNPSTGLFRYRNN